MMPVPPKLGHGPVSKALAVFLAAAALVLPATGWCEDDVGASLLLGLYTRHVDPSDDTNESSQLLGLGYRDYTVAGFVNSYDDQSYFAGKRFHTQKFSRGGNGDWFVQGNLYAGLLYGYDDHVPNLEGFSPGLLPTVGVGYRNCALEMLYVPTPRGGVFLSFLSFRLGRNEKQPVAARDCRRETKGADGPAIGRVARAEVARSGGPDQPESLASRALAADSAGMFRPPGEAGLPGLAPDP